jgi:hypothetical protein
MVVEPAGRETNHSSDFEFAMTSDERRERMMQRRSRVSINMESMHFIERLSLKLTTATL